MTSMPTVLSIRLPQRDLVTIKEIAKTENKDNSTTIRELVQKGLLYLALSRYKQGSISLGKAAELAHLSVSEMNDLLTELGIESSIDVDDYLEGTTAAQKLF